VQSQIAKGVIAEQWVLGQIATNPCLIGQTSFPVTSFIPKDVAADQRRMPPGTAVDRYDSLAECEYALLRLELRVASAENTRASTPANVTNDCRRANRPI